MVNRQKRILKSLFRIAFAGIFFTAACLHLSYSPHHQNLSNYQPIADFGAIPGPCNLTAPNYVTKIFNTFPVDFELPEQEFRLVKINVRSYLDYLHQFEILPIKDAFLHRHLARPPPS